MAAVQEKNTELNKQGLNLGVLEDKVIRLVEAVQHFKAESIRLAEENARLRQSLDTLERSLMVESKDLEKLSEEKAMAKVAVEDLIKSIDFLISDSQ
jgi:regulator of replication initiation timing